MTATFLVLVTTSAFVLFEYSHYLVGERNTDHLSTPPDASHLSGYLPFDPSRTSASTQSAVKTLRPATNLPTSCLDAHIAQGELCYNPATPRIDVLWTWVNGSDPVLQDAKRRIEDQMPPNDPYRPTSSWKKERQYRDHDELRYSMRSALDNFRQSAGSFHLISTDFAVPSNWNIPSIPRGSRLGQIPHWLDGKSQWVDGHVKLDAMHHIQFFQPYTDNIFNSYAVESQLGNLEGISENFVYMNDDFFFLRPVTERTFYTSAYGLVLRMQADSLVSANPYANNVKGEWLNLAMSNSLLSARFGSRQRPYMVHEAKSASLSLLHEIHQIWTKELTTAASHPFRETKSGEADVSTMFMLVHFVVERWREALLWTWVVGKHGGLDDSWDQDMARAAWKDLGGDIDDPSQLVVRAGVRDTLNPERVSSNLRASGLKQTDQTKYAFSSQDGYPYVGFINGIKNFWPQFGRDVLDRRLPQCKLDVLECFQDEADQDFTRASDVFVNVAFRKPSCGDCMIVALVKASGETGLSAFLPDASRILPSLAGKIPSADPEIPHLPLVDRWEDGKFPLREVMDTSRDVNVRMWALQLLQRYRFVIGDTPAYFAMLTAPLTVETMVRKLKSRPEVALLCINDDVTRDDSEVSKVFQRWAKATFPQPAAWEVR